MMKAAIHVPDLDSPSQAAAIEALKERLPGIKDICASVPHRMVEVTFEEGQIPGTHIRAALEALGCHPGPFLPMPALAKAILPVAGMSCASCAWVIETRLRELPGVTDASVDLAGEFLRVEFDRARVGLPAILRLVKQTGYTIPTGKVELPILGLGDPSAALPLERLLARQ